MLRIPLGIFAFLLLLAACGENSRPATLARRADCESRPDGSRWAPAAPYRATAAAGRGEADWLSEAGGLAVRDSLVFVYDAPEGRVRAMTDSLTLVRTFGRRGGGPGEMRPFTSRGSLGPQWQWLAASGDTLLVFDGIAVHGYSPDGRFLGRAYDDAVRRSDLNDGSPSIASLGGGLLSSWGGYHVPVLREPPDRYRWSVVHHSSGRPDTVLSLQLTPLPQMGGGVGFEGPAQARPVWGASRDCVVATDGGGGWMVRADVPRAGIDTVSFALPEVALPAIDKDEIARLSRMVGKGRGGYPEPTLEKRISSLIVDPDGYAWVLPSQDTAQAAAGLAIVRISLATGRAVHDTVPAFPLAFGRPGVFYARTNDRFSGVAEIVRYEAGTGRAGGVEPDG